MILDIHAGNRILRKERSLREMKIISTVLFAGMVLGLILASNANAVPTRATLTADNHYGLFFGGESDITFVGRNEIGPRGAPGTYNWSIAENFAFDLDIGDYIYVAAWSDDRVAQGLIGQFVAGSNVILTNTLDWEVCLTGNDLDDYALVPSLAEIKAEISSATWSPITNTISYGDGPWGFIDGISNEAQWIWGSALLPGSAYGEYQIFRTQVTHAPEPATMVLFGSGLIGLATLRKRFKKT